MDKKPILLWAIDPFSKDVHVCKPFAMKLSNWAKRSNIEIQPVHVVRIPEFLPANLLEDGVNGFLEGVEKLVKISLSELGVENCLRPKILIKSSTSSKDAVDRFCEYANETNPRWIAVSSHGRSGLPRMILGSFAENLLGQSKFPIFFMTDTIENEKADKPCEMKRALFPTDLSEFSKKAFLNYLKDAKQFQMEVTLFCSVSLPIEALAAVSGAPVVIPDDFFKNQMNFAKEEIERWASLAKEQGVSVKTVVHDGGINSQIGESVMTAASQAGANVIVMASVSGPLKTFVAGSVSRSVFRANRFPVLVYGPHALE